MKALYLFLLALPIFVFGYRFYAKYLVLSTHPLDDETATPAHQDRPNSEYSPAPKALLYAHHLASISGGTTIIGVTLAVAWGWIPAFLWIVTGTVIAAGVYGLSMMWWSLQHEGADPAGLGGALLGTTTQHGIRLLGIGLLVMLMGLLALIIGQLLDRYPTMVLAFWLQIPLALGLAAVWRRHPRTGLWLLLPMPLLLLAAVIGADILPLDIGGAVNLKFADLTLLRIDATFIWIALVLVYGALATRAPVETCARPRSAMATCLAVIMVLAIIIASTIDLTPVVAPTFNTEALNLGITPWLFILLSGGALAGYHGLIASGSTLRQLDRQSDARAIGYGGALGDGLIALSVLVVCSAGYANLDAWQQSYAGWDALNHPGDVLNQFLQALANLLAVFGLRPGTSQPMAALVLASLALATIETGLRVLRQLLAPGLSTLPIRRLQKPGQQAWLAAGLVGLLAVADGAGSGALGLWPVMLSANQIFAGLMLIMIWLYLRRGAKPTLAVGLPLGLILITANWALITQFIGWFETRSWIRLGVAGLLLGFELWVMITVAIRYKSLCGMNDDTKVEAQ
ncbi:MAG TPA: carbon starvation protein A [Acidiferrobacteraceae bacterium]|nr:carbon starvation protein A [Acidiferrobacteraceae bacterium]